MSTRCDRGNARVQVFDKLGVLKRAVPIDPEGFSYQPLRTNDIGFSSDAPQAFFYTSDVGSGTVWILNHVMGGVVRGIGRMGNHAGEFIGVHTWRPIRRAISTCPKAAVAGPRRSSSSKNRGPRYCGTLIRGCLEAIS